MEIVKIIGIGLIGLILAVLLKQYKPEFSIYISLITGILILILSFNKISAIVELLVNLSNKLSIHQEFLSILIKITGIAILTEFSVSVCKDTGETAIASKIDMGGKVIIIGMSIPIMISLIETLLKILP